MSNITVKRTDAPVIEIVAPCSLTPSNTLTVKPTIVHRGISLNFKQAGGEGGQIVFYREDADDFLDAVAEMLGRKLEPPAMSTVEIIRTSSPVVRITAKCATVPDDSLVIKPTSQGRGLNIGIKGYSDRDYQIILYGKDAVDVLRGAAEMLGYRLVPGS